MLRLKIRGDNCEPVHREGAERLKAWSLHRWQAYESIFSAPKNRFLLSAADTNRYFADVTNQLSVVVAVKSIDSSRSATKERGVGWWGRTITRKGSDGSSLVEGVFYSVRVPIRVGSSRMPPPGSSEVAAHRHVTACRCEDIRGIDLSLSIWGDRSTSVSI